MSYAKTEGREGGGGGGGKVSLLEVMKNWMVGRPGNEDRKVTVHRNKVLLQHQSQATV